MERVITCHLEEVGVMYALSKHQYAFRKGKSTATILSEVVDSIDSAILRDIWLFGGFLNIKWAFDNIQTFKVLEGLRAEGCLQNIIEWYGHYFTSALYKSP